MADVEEEELAYPDVAGEAGDGDGHSEAPSTTGSGRRTENVRTQWTAEEWDEWLSWYRPWWQGSSTGSSPGAFSHRGAHDNGHGLPHPDLPGAAASAAWHGSPGPRLPHQELPAIITPARLPQQDRPGSVQPARSSHSGGDPNVSRHASSATPDTWGGWGSAGDPWADAGGGVRDDENPQDVVEHQSWSLRGSQQGAGGNDKIAVPEFSGEDDKDGLKARGYLRKIEAWRRVTRLAPEKQALVLYNGLTGRAWRDAEDIDLSTLEHPKGVDVFKNWITDKYLDKEIIKVGKYMHEFFKSHRRGPGQDIREFNMEFDRLTAKLKEVGCKLPDVCLAWWYVDKLRLDNSGELNLLSSTGNRYELTRLQDAAVIQDRGSRRLWEQNRKGERRGQQALMAEAEIAEESDALLDADLEDPEEMEFEECDAEAHEAYVAFQNAKQKYQGMLRARGAQVEKSKEERIRLAKARSFCSVCKKKGHWHRDPECPANQNRKQPTQEAHVVYYTGMDSAGTRLWAITDCACSRTLAGPTWVKDYVKIAKKFRWPYFQIDQEETFKFGGRTLFPSTKALICWLHIEGRWFCVKIARVAAEVPLLLSRPTLATLGMEFNMATNKANFRALGLEAMQLDLSESGHPRFEIVDPRSFPPDWPPGVDWSMTEVIVPKVAEAYMVVAANERVQEPSSQPFRTIFYPKNLEEIYVQAFTAEHLAPELFMSWWKETPVSRDFWIESEGHVDRIHVTPRKYMFDPSKWNTTVKDLKDELLAVLGETRTSTCVPCVDGKLVLEVAHDWKVEDGKHAGYLWIGRSRFKRRTSASQFVEPQAFIVLNEPAKPMEDEEARVGGGTSRSRSPVSEPLDSAGAQASGVGSEGTPSEEGHGDLRSQLGAVDREMQSRGHHNSTEADKGGPGISVEEKLPAGLGRGGDLRPLCGLQVQGAPQEVPRLGGDRGGQQSQPLSGIGKIGKVASEAIGRWGNWIYSTNSCSQSGGATRGSTSPRPSEAKAEGEGPEQGEGGADHHTTEKDEASRSDIHRERVQLGERSPQDNRAGDQGADRAVEYPSSGAERGTSIVDPGAPSRTQVKKRNFWDDVDTCMEAKRAKKRDRELQPGDYEPGATSPRSSMASTSSRTMTTDPDAAGASSGGESCQRKRLREVFNVFGNQDAASAEEKEEITMEQKVHLVMGNDQDHVRNLPTHKIRRTSRKKIKSWTQKTFSALMVAMMAYTTPIVEELRDVVIEPVKDVYYAFGGRPETEDVALLELFAGSANLTTEFAKRGHSVLEPRDLKFGHDISKLDVQEQILRDIEYYKPKLLWVALPCTKWSPWQRINYAGRENQLKAERRKARKLVRFAARAAVVQLANGGDIGFEHPHGSDMWEDGALDPILANPEVISVSLDMCQFNLRAKSDGGLGY